MKSAATAAMCLRPPQSTPSPGKSTSGISARTEAPPQVTLAQVSWLALNLTGDSPEALIPQPFDSLAATTRDFISNGALEGERNNRLFAAACDLSGNDYDQHTALQLLRRRPPRRDCPDQKP